MGVLKIYIYSCLTSKPVNKLAQNYAACKKTIYIKIYIIEKNHLFNRNYMEERNDCPIFTTYIVLLILVSNNTLPKLIAVYPL